MISKISKRKIDTPHQKGIPVVDIEHDSGVRQGIIYKRNWVHLITINNSFDIVIHLTSIPKDRGLMRDKLSTSISALNQLMEDIRGYDK